MEFWICPLNHRAYKFLVKIKDILSKFENKINFIPKIKFMDMR